MLQNPFPGDARFSKANANDNRFENLEINLDVVAGKSRTKNMTNMYHSTSRKDIFTKKDSNPDGNIYMTTQYKHSL